MYKANWYRNFEAMARIHNFCRSSDTLEAYTLFGTTTLVEVDSAIKERSIV
jgi:hypothetical protein